MIPFLMGLMPDADGWRGETFVNDGWPSADGNLELDYGTHGPSYRVPPANKIMLEITAKHSSYPGSYSFRQVRWNAEGDGEWVPQENGLIGDYLGYAGAVACERNFDAGVPVGHVAEAELGTDLVTWWFDFGGSTSSGGTFSWEDVTINVTSAVGTGDVGGVLVNLDADTYWAVAGDGTFVFAVDNVLLSTTQEWTLASGQTWTFSGGSGSAVVFAWPDVTVTGPWVFESSLEVCGSYVPCAATAVTLTTNQTYTPAVYRPILPLNPTVDIILYGFVPQVPGAVYTVVNVGSASITLPQESTSSSSVAYRFRLPTNSTALPVVLQPGMRATFRDDVALGRVRVEDVANYVPPGAAAFLPELSSAPTTGTGYGAYYFDSATHRPFAVDQDGNLYDLSSGGTYAETIGDGATTTFTITHNLGTRDVGVFIWKAASDYSREEATVKAATTDTVTVTFTVAPSAGQFRVVVFKAGLGGSGAPVDAEYLVLSLDGTLTDERVLEVTDPLELADGGAGASATLSISRNGVPQWSTTTVPYNNATLAGTAGTTATVAVVTLPAKANVLQAVLRTKTTFTAPGLSVLNMRINRDGNDVTVAGDLRTANSFQQKSADATGTDYMGVQSITATTTFNIVFGATGANLNTLTAGEVELHLLYSTVPAA